MADRHSFKSDESFLEKIAIGAIGTQRVFDDLKSQGHNPLELERGSMSFKIWKKIKIKRIRVPDLLCVDCGRRVESRAKTAFEVSMSHSQSDPERSWDYSLDDEDLVSFVACHKIAERPIDWKASDFVQYVLVGELRAAQREEKAILVKPKGAEEGFEARLNWPAAIAKSSGKVIRITPDRIQYRRDIDNRSISLSLHRHDIYLTPLANVGDSISESQIIGTVVPVSRYFLCRKNATEAHYLDLLSNVALNKRYASAKALSFFESDISAQALASTVANSDEHIYVRLEAAASLTRKGNEYGVEFIKSCLADDFLQNRLEAVIVLSEIATASANQLLVSTLTDTNQHSEIRAGAAWALGELRSKGALNALIDCFIAVDNGIRVEAARALAKLASEHTPDLIRQLQINPPELRPGIAWALSKSGLFSLQDLIYFVGDDDVRQWIAYILGTQGQEKFVHDIELLRAKDPEIYFAVTVLWKIMSSWVYGMEEY